MQGGSQSASLELLGSLEPESLVHPLLWKASRPNLAPTGGSQFVESIGACSGWAKQEAEKQSAKREVMTFWSSKIITYNLGGTTNKMERFRY